MKTKTRNINKVADYVLHVVLVLLALLVLSGILLSSCTKPTIYTERPISMSLTMPGTKGVINNNDDFNNQGTFGVFGYKVQDKTLVSESSAYHVFTNQEVDYNNSAWDYTPTKYWDQKTGMHYSFIAYAPYCDSETVGPNVQASMEFAVSPEGTSYYALKMNNVPSWQDASSNDCKDIMISNPEWGFGTDFVGKQNKPCYVEFTFKHILALIDLKAYVADGMEYKVSNISVGKNSNNYKVPTADSENTYSQGILRKTTDETTWIDPTKSIGETGIAEWHNSAADHTKDIELDPDTDVEGTPKLINKQLAFPFSVEKLSMSVTFLRQGSVEYDTVDKDINLSNIESGKHYTIILRFEGGDVVDVNVSEVQDWITVNQEHPVYNW